MPEQKIDNLTVQVPFLKIDKYSVYSKSQVVNPEDEVLIFTAFYDRQHTTRHFG